MEVPSYRPRPYPLYWKGVGETCAQKAKARVMCETHGKPMFGVSDMTNSRVIAECFCEDCDIASYYGIRGD